VNLKTATFLVGAVGKVELALIVTRVAVYDLSSPKGYWALGLVVGVPV
jgi:hypothetical protein